MNKAELNKAEMITEPLIIRQGIHQTDHQRRDRKTEDITLWAMSSYSGQKGPA